MASDISSVTGEQFYSGTFLSMIELMRTLDIGEGKMSRITQVVVNRFQENTDRAIDAILQEVVATPLRAMNQVQPDGTTKRVFPGDVRWAARYWTAGVLLLAEFQQLEQNLTDQCTAMIEDAKKQIFAMTKPSHFVPGQRRKSNLSKTCPPNLQPPDFPENPS